MSKSSTVFEVIWKKIIYGIGTAGIIIAILLAWDQLTVNYARAAEVKKNSEHLYQLTDAIKTLVEVNTKTRLYIQLEIADRRIYELEKKYHGSKVMSDQVKRFYKRLLQDKKDIQKRIDE